MASTITQEAFDKKYITPNEIEQRLSVARSTILYARKKGTLPNAIYITGANIYIWERELLEPHLVKWAEQLTERRRKSAELLNG